MWKISQILEALKNEILDYKISNQIEINEVVIDSRKKTNNGLFVAIKGEKNDGHNFINQSYENGAKLALIDRKVENINDYILVKDSFKALYALAKYVRDNSKAKIIAVTGSVGKTSTKNMIAYILSFFGKTYSTPGNFNNHFGLPLSLCNFSFDNQYGIFEIGMNHANEISPLVRILKPDIAIITNVEAVHIENFKNEEAIAYAKAEIFDALEEDSYALINYDNRHFNLLKNILQKRIENNKLNKFFTFSLNNDLADYKMLSCDNNSVRLIINNDLIEINSTSSHEGFLSSVLISIAVADILALNYKVLVDKFHDFEFGEGRGKVKEMKLLNSASSLISVAIIDDSYNASLPSIKAGIKNAVNLKKKLRKDRLIVAIGDMLELGESSKDIHQEVAKIIYEYNIDFVILVGNECRYISSKLPPQKHVWFEDSFTAAKSVLNYLNDNDLLYVKGSRGMKMEMIINKILENVRS